MPRKPRWRGSSIASGKFYVFLRTIRSELFDEGFQAELAAVYRPRGTRPIPPALLAMVLLLQAYDQVGDAEAVENATVDPRWQLALGCLGAARAPFSQGALVAFRERLIAHDLDKRLLDQTVALAKARGGFGWQHLRAAAGFLAAAGRGAHRGHLESDRARAGDGRHLRGPDLARATRARRAGAPG